MMSDDMTFQDASKRGYTFVPVDFDGIESLPPTIDGMCPKCNLKMKYLHDLRCSLCDNQYIQYCDNCEGHYRLAKVKEY